MGSCTSSNKQISQPQLKNRMNQGPSRGDRVTFSDSHTQPFVEEILKSQDLTIAHIVNVSIQISAEKKVVNFPVVSSNNLLQPIVSTSEVFLLTPNHWKGCPGDGRSELEKQAQQKPEGESNASTTDNEHALKMRPLVRQDNRLKNPIPSNNRENHHCEDSLLFTNTNLPKDERIMVNKGQNIHNIQKEAENNSYFIFKQETGIMIKVPLLCTDIRDSTLCIRRQKLWPNHLPINVPDNRKASFSNKKDPNKKSPQLASVVDWHTAHMAKNTPHS